MTKSRAGCDVEAHSRNRTEGTASKAEPSRRGNALRVLQAEDAAFEVERIALLGHAGRPVARGFAGRRIPAARRLSPRRYRSSGKMAAQARRARGRCPSPSRCASPGRCFGHRRIPFSLKRSAERSRRRKAEPYRSALSMLVFYINRAGKKLPASRRRTLERAKSELRRQFGRD